MEEGRMKSRSAPSCGRASASRTLQMYLNMAHPCVGDAQRVTATTARQVLPRDRPESPLSRFRSKRERDRRERTEVAHQDMKIAHKATSTRGGGRGRSTGAGDKAHTLMERIREAQLMRLRRQALSAAVAPAAPVVAPIARTPHPKPEHPYLHTGLVPKPVWREETMATVVKETSGEGAAPSVVESPLQTAIRVLTAAQKIQSVWRKRRLQACRESQRTPEHPSPHESHMTTASPDKEVESAAMDAQSVVDIERSCEDNLPVEAVDVCVGSTGQFGVSGGVKEAGDKRRRVHVGVLALLDQSALEVSDNGACDGNDAGIRGVADMWLDDEWSFLEEGRCTLANAPLLDSSLVNDDQSIQALVWTKPQLVAQMQESKRLQALEQRRQYALQQASKLPLAMGAAQTETEAYPGAERDPQHVADPMTHRGKPKRIRIQLTGGKWRKECIFRAIQSKTRCLPLRVQCHRSKARDTPLGATAICMPSRGSSCDDAAVVSLGTPCRLLGEEDASVEDRMTAMHYVVFSDLAAEGAGQCVTGTDRNDLIALGDLAVVSPLLKELTPSNENGERGKGDSGFIRLNDTCLLPLHPERLVNAKPKASANDDTTDVTKARSFSCPPLLDSSLHLSRSIDIHELNGSEDHQVDDASVQDTTDEYTRLQQDDRDRGFTGIDEDRGVIEDAPLDELSSAASSMWSCARSEAVFPPLWEVEVEVTRTLDRIQAQYHAASFRHYDSRFEDVAVPMASHVIGLVDTAKREKFLQVLHEFKTSLRNSTALLPCHGSERSPGIDTSMQLTASELAVSASEATGDDPHCVESDSSATDSGSRSRAYDQDTDDEDPEVNDSEMQAMLAEIQQCKAQFMRITRRGQGQDLDQDQHLNQDSMPTAMAIAARPA